MSHRRKDFIVYPPLYEPGDGFVIEKTVKAAKRQCRKFGVGATVIPWIMQHPGRCKPWETSWSTVRWEYG